MTSKIVVNNIEADAGVSTVTFNSNVVRGGSNLHSTGLALGAGSTVGAVTGVTTYYGDGSQLTGLTSPAISAIASDGANRVLTSDGDGTATAHSFVTIESSRLSVNRGSGSGAFPLIVRRTDASGIIAEFANSSGYGLLIGQNSATGEAYLRTGTGQPMVFTTNAGSGIANERMRIHSNGAVSIANTRNYYGALNVEAGVITSNSSAIDIKASGTDKQAISFGDHNTISGELRITNSSKISLGTSSNHPFTFYTGTGRTERMRLTTNANGTGAMYINQTTEVSGANSHLVVNNSVAIVSGSTFRSFYMSGNGNAYFWNGSNQPYISSSGNFTNASDISLKKDITDLTYGIDVLKNLKPRKYKMKTDDKEQIGFIAQEVETAVPEVVDSSETPNGDQHKGLAYGNLTAVLTKALQEAVTKIETLEAKVAALEGS